MCDLLADRMAQLQIPCDVVSDAELLKAKGITVVPALEDAEGNLMNFAQAMKFLSKGVSAE